MNHALPSAALVLAACRLAHVDPAPRSEWAEQLTIASVVSTCSEPDPFGGGSITWRDPLTATGVIISERHILTAAHVDMCPTIPGVTVHAAGQHLRMVFERNDSMFGADIARLELASAAHFGIGIPPPRIALPLLGETLCYVTLHGRACGMARRITDRVVDVRAGTVGGDSGSPLYNAGGDLIGIATRGDGVDTEADLVGAYWLEGT